MRNPSLVAQSPFAHASDAMPLSAVLPHARCSFRRGLRRSALLAVGMLALAGLSCTVAAPPARAQSPNDAPVVGVVKVTRQPVTETNEFVGRVQATDRVDIVARVTGFLEKRAFVEGSEVHRGDVLYELERGPFEADLAAKQAAVAQQQALLRNATITLNRARTLLSTPAGQRSTVDDAEAQQASVAAQLQSAQAQVRASQINLDYTVIRSPIDGRIGRTSLTEGNVVTPSSGTLTTIVSQDPMYVLFPISVRQAFELRDRFVAKSGSKALVVKLRLPSGRIYDHSGTIDYVDPTVARGTDTLTLRAHIANPLQQLGDMALRDLVDGEFVTVLVEGAEPVMELAVPRAAVMTDQQGSFVYVVGAGDKAELRRITLGQSTPRVAVVTGGLKEGETVVADGLQRVRPGQPVKPVPAEAAPGAPAHP